MTFVIFFNGKLKPGVSKEQTRTILQKLSGLGADAVEQRFFSGKTVSIKKCHSQEEATKAWQYFDKAGLDVSISRAAEPPQPVTVEKEAPKPQLPLKGEPKEGELKAPPRPVLEAPVDSQPIQAKPRRLSVPWVKIGLGVLALVLVAVFFGGFWLQTLVRPSMTEKAKHAEAAVYSNNSLAIGHINVQKLAQIESVFRGEDKLPLNTQPLLRQLASEGIDPRRDIYHIVFSIDYDEALGATYAMVVVGQFSQDRIEAFFAKTYETANVSLAARPHTLFKKQDVKTCEYSAPKAYVAKDGLLVMAHPDKIAALLMRLEDPKLVAALPEQWLEYRSQHLASIGVLEPKHLDKAADGMLSFMLRGVSGSDTPLNGVYAGLRGTALPPAISAEFLLNVNDPQWLQSTQKQMDKHIAGMKTNKNTAGILQTLAKGLTTQATDGSLAASITINKNFVQEVEQTLAAGLGSLFSASVISDGEDGSEVVPDKIDKAIKPYAVDLGDYEPAPYKANSGQVLAWQQGPVAVEVDSVSLTKEGVTEINLVAKAQNLPNMGDAKLSAPGYFKVTSVSDSKGKNILREETCGESMNRIPVSFGTGFSGERQAQKSIRLKQGSSFSDVEAINGEISIAVATKTQSQVIPAPILDKTLSLQGATLRIHQAENNKLKYSIKGIAKNLVDIRPLNTDKKYLSGGGGFSSGAREEGHLSVSQSIQGKVGFLEVTTAQLYKPFAYSFTLGSAVPGFSKSSPRTIWTLPTAFKLSDWNRFENAAQGLKVHANTYRSFGTPIASERAGPIYGLLFEHKIDKGFGKKMRGSGHYLIAVPVNTALKAMPGLLELNLKKIKLMDGTVFNVDVKQRTGQFSETPAASANLPAAEPYLFNTKRFNYEFEPSTPYTGVARVASLEGDFLLKLPLAYKTHSAPFGGLGKIFKNRNFTVYLKNIERSRLHLYLEGDLGSIANIVLKDETGTELNTAFDIRGKTVFDQFFTPEPGKKPNAIGELSFMGGVPHEFMIVEAAQQQLKRYPFAFEVAPQ